MILISAHLFCALSQKYTKSWMLCWKLKMVVLHFCFQVPWAELEDIFRIIATNEIKFHKFDGLSSINVICTNKWNITIILNLKFTKLERLDVTQSIFYENVTKKIRETKNYGYRYFKESGLFIPILGTLTKQLKDSYWTSGEWY